ncbi:MAG: hypothetical protein QOD99_2662 [Chthoniobacter sp.]|nr:hypothetical protein [Chthoniobacter sp.]
MRCLQFISPILAAGVFCLQPVSLFADDKKDKKGAPHAAKGKPQAVLQAQAAARQANMARMQNSPTRNDLAGSSRSTQAARIAAQHSEATTSVQHSTRRGYQTNPTARFGLHNIQGNRSNRYNGRWIEASRHRDWDRHREHEWNHHRYCYYDGGWIIIDTAPSYVYYDSGPSLGLAGTVQERLADQGYYRGPIDGDIGPRSRRAIADYQADYGLRITGNINDALLDSLGLQ